MTKRKWGVTTKLNTSLTLDIELTGRLRRAGLGVHGGISRVAEDCIRSYLPIYEYFQKEKESTKRRNELERALVHVMLQPESLGQVMAIAFREILKNDPNCTEV